MTFCKGFLQNICLGMYESICELPVKFIILYLLIKKKQWVTIIVFELLVADSA